MIRFRPRQGQALSRPFSAGAIAALLVLAGCGGGSDGAALALDVSDGGDARMSALASGGAIGWTLCAGEGETCTVGGTRQVRYGTESVYVVRTVTGGVACTNAVFGDPVYGTRKSCWVADDGAVATPAATTWTSCGSEGQTCSFQGSRQVRYGANGQYAYGTYTDRVACSNAVFGDPLWGTLKSCAYAADAAPTTAAPTTAAAPAPTSAGGAAATGTSPPIVFNASAGGNAGDVVTLQGENFGAAPTVTLDGASGTPLAIVNQVGSGWISVQLPASVTGAMTLRVANATGVSAPVRLNAARPLHLDTMQIVPGGTFRLFGRNLLAGGSVPVVTVDGAAATVDLSKSDEHMLTLAAPAALRAGTAALVTVDNGNGSGASTLDRTLSTLASTGASDPFAIGVGWARAFATISGTVVDAARDARLASRVACNGARDDGAAIQSAIEWVATNGGGVVQLPAGRCRLQTGLSLRPKVVVQGAGKSATELVYETNYPVWAERMDLVGLRNLTLTNAGTSTEGMMLKNSTRVVLQNVRVNLGTSRQMYLSGNQQFAVVGSEFVQAGSISHQGPYVFDDSAALFFEGNTTQWVDGAPSFARIHDSYVHASRFVRDATSQAFNGGTVHSMVIEFAHRTAIVGNTFEVLNGPITNTQRNDGETILTEGGGGSRTENLGTVGSATATTLTDPANTLNVDPFNTGSIPENYGVAIVGGKGAGQSRRITAYAQRTMTVDRPWDVVPDATSRYATFVWGLEKSLIKGNVLNNNPRGIWLYSTAIRDVDVVGNVISEGGGIYLRAHQNLAQKMFTPIWNVRVMQNRVTNTTGRWMSYINAVFVNLDAKAFGIATLGIEIRNNRLVANPVNVSSNSEEYAGTEGYMNMMRIESNSPYESSPTPRLLGTIFAANNCTNCSAGIRLGTGAGGTTILGTTLVNSPTALTDWATAGSAEKSTNTVVR